MSIEEFVSQHPAVDHHCHSIWLTDPNFREFHSGLTEGFDEAPGSNGSFDTPLGLAVRKWCAPLLDLEPMASATEYWERRQELGQTKVARRLMKASQSSHLLVDNGWNEGLMSLDQLAEVAGGNISEIVRIEAVAEEVLSSHTDVDNYVDALEHELATRIAKGRGFKSIAAYRTGLDLDPAEPTREEVREAFQNNHSRRASVDQIHLDDQVLIRHALTVARSLAAKFEVPIQFHTGLGDPDAVLPKVDPGLLAPWIERCVEQRLNVCLLHCYPFQQSASHLAAIYPNVFVDVGLALSYAGPNARTILRDIFDMAPFSKHLYSSDAVAAPELYLVSSRIFRTELARLLDSWQQDGYLTSDKAERIAAAVLWGNATRLYGLEA